MATVSIEPQEQPTRHAGDTFASGVLIMLSINAIQRIVGLLRGIGFCQFMSEDQLGQWALVNSFFVIAVPLALLGLPGSFSRFVEHYRHRGQLGDFLRSVLSVSALGVLACIGWMACFPASFSWLVFEQPPHLETLMWCGLSFGCLIGFSIVHEIVGSLRHIRVVAIMQFLQSVGFAMIGLPWLAMTGSWLVLLPSFAAACLIAVLPGLWVIISFHATELVPGGVMDHRRMWSRVLPFAASLWLINLLANLFEVSDRYMLLHLNAAGADVGLSLVGQYHCGRLLPNLLTSVAMMLSGVLLPYLAADWEAGKTEAIAARLRQMLYCASIGFMGLSVAALLVAPFLFRFGFAGRYAAAEFILPLALVQAIWAGLFLIAQSYLLCAERGRRLAVLLAIGVGCNLILNWFAIQSFGLMGAVGADGHRHVGSALAAAVANRKSPVSYELEHDLHLPRTRNRSLWADRYHGGARSYSTNRR